MRPVRGENSRGFENHKWLEGKSEKESLERQKEERKERMHGRLAIARFVVLGHFQKRGMVGPRPTFAMKMLSSGNMQPMLLVESLPLGNFVV